MRKSAAVKLTLVPMLAASALAFAQAPGDPQPTLSPPGLTPTIHELDCDEDPNWQLRTDCTDGELLGTPGGPYVVVRGGYGHYFWTGGG